MTPLDTSNPPIQPPVIVLGMHRSGTSCLTGSLQQAGLVLGDVHTANPFNKKGNREHPELMQLHEALLQANGGSWHNPPETVAWPEAFRLKREAFCEQFAGVPQWGFKDPRALLALEGWIERFPSARLVGTIRHPMSVARSLYSRDPNLHTINEYMDLWGAYNERLLAASKRYGFPVVDFDEEDAVYMAAIKKVLRKLNLRPSWRERLKRSGLRGLLGQAPEDQPFFDPALRSQRTLGVEGLPADIASLYLELKKLAG